MLSVVEPSLAEHLRERDLKFLDEMVQMADLYQETHTETTYKSKVAIHGLVGRNLQCKSNGVTAERE